MDMINSLNVIAMSLKRSQGTTALFQVTLDIEQIFFAKNVLKTGTW